MTKKNMMSAFPSSPSAPADPAALASVINDRHSATLNTLRSMIRHPRSLARPSAAWRPPSRDLPRTGLDDDLTVAVTRRRVGPRARARVKGYGETHDPAYLIELRITDRSGLPADPVVAEAWVRALVPGNLVSAVHEIPAPRAISYVWLVDGTYAPVLSPSSMFEDLSAA
ncbi:hypothetical protein [Corynebacterium sp. UBA2622]|uniref:hypothetical protein n=1 Tax=Corynebacterium sp. UBA2622 TaxID=1946393 RepID=UPI0025C672F1|nr:hypothetical protein [Corynebacterium sp. UBA2622]